MTNLQRYTYPTFDNAMTGSFLTPPLPKGSKKKLYLDRQGCQILIEQGKIFRERGWWLSGQDKLASDSTNLKAGWQQGRLWMPNSSLHSREHCNAPAKRSTFSRGLSTSSTLPEWHGNGTDGSPLLCPRHLCYRLLTRRGPNGGWGLHSQVWDGLALSGVEKQ